MANAATGNRRASCRTGGSPQVHHSLKFADEGGPRSLQLHSTHLRRPTPMGRQRGSWPGHAQLDDAGDRPARAGLQKIRLQRVPGIDHRWPVGVNGCSIGQHGSAVFDKKLSTASFGFAASSASRRPGCRLEGLHSHMTSCAALAQDAHFLPVTSYAVNPSARKGARVAGSRRSR